MASLPLVSAPAAISGYCQLHALKSVFSLKSGEERRFFERFPERIRMKEPQKVPMWGKLIKRKEKVDNTLPASKKLIYFAAGNTLRSSPPYLKGFKTLLVDLEHTANATISVGINPYQTSPRMVYAFRQ